MEADNAASVPPGEGHKSPQPCASRAGTGSVATRWGVRLTTLLAAIGGFDIAAGLWHHHDPTTILVGAFCLALAVVRSVAP